MRWLLVAVLAVVLVRWFTFDLQPVPEIAAMKVMRVQAPGPCANALTYLPTYTGGDTAPLIDANEAYCVEPAYGDGSALSVTLRNEEGLHTLGAEVHAPVTLRLRFAVAAPPGHTFVVLRDGQEVASSEKTDFELRIQTPGTYRVELTRLVPTWYFGHERVTWIVTFPFIVLPGLA